MDPPPLVHRQAVDTWMEPWQNHGVHVRRTFARAGLVLPSILSSYIFSSELISCGQFMSVDGHGMAQFRFSFHDVLELPLGEYLTQCVWISKEIRESVTWCECWSVSIDVVVCQSLIWVSWVWLSMYVNFLKERPWLYYCVPLHLLSINSAELLWLRFSWMIWFQKEEKILAPVRFLMRGD